MENLLSFKDPNRKICHCSPYCWQLAPSPNILPPPPRSWLNPNNICDCNECKDKQSIFETHKPTRQEVLKSLKEYKDDNLLNELIKIHS